MTIKNLYRYENSDGSISISPIQREETDPPYMFRVIADEGKVLTDGIIITPCVDTHMPEIYTERDEPADPTPEEELKDAKEALNILGVN